MAAAEVAERPKEPYTLPAQQDMPQLRCVICAKRTSVVRTIQCNHHEHQTADEHTYTNTDGAEHPDQQTYVNTGGHGNEQQQTYMNTEQGQNPQQTYENAPGGATYENADVPPPIPERQYQNVVSSNGVLMRPKRPARPSVVDMEEGHHASASGSDPSHGAPVSGTDTGAPGGGSDPEGGAKHLYQNTPENGADPGTGHVYQNQDQQDHYYQNQPARPESYDPDYDDLAVVSPILANPERSGDEYEDPEADPDKTTTQDEIHFAPDPHELKKQKKKEEKERKKKEKEDKKKREKELKEQKKQEKESAKRSKTAGIP